MFAMYAFFDSRKVLQACVNQNATTSLENRQDNSYDDLKEIQQKHAYAIKRRQGYILAVLYCRAVGTLSPGILGL